MSKLNLRRSLAVATLITASSLNWIRILVVYIAVAVQNDTQATAQALSTAIAEGETEAVASSLANAW